MWTIGKGRNTGRGSEEDLLRTWLFYEIFLIWSVRRFEMKKTILIACMVGLMAFSGATIACAQPMGPGYGYGMGPGMMGPGYGYGMGPGMMGPGYAYGMGPGMMGPGYGYGRGPGMMGPGYGYGYGMGPGYGYGNGPQYGYGRQYQQSQKPLDKEQVQQEVDNYLKSTRNPNLKIGKIEEKGNDYEVDIETKGGSLVDKLLIDKDTGWMRSGY
jgi:hypothetical protein